MSLVNLSHVCSHLQNASLARLGLTSIPYSRLHLSLSLLLLKQGFISQLKLGGPSPPASCFPPGLRDQNAISSHPYAERGSMTPEGALQRMVVEGWSADRLLNEGYTEEDVDFALINRPKDQAQLAREGWDDVAFDFLIKHIWRRRLADDEEQAMDLTDPKSWKSRDEMLADGLNPEDIAIIQSQQPLLASCWGELMKKFAKEIEDIQVKQQRITRDLSKTRGDEEAQRALDNEHNDLERKLGDKMLEARTTPQTSFRYRQAVMSKGLPVAALAHVAGPFNRLRTERDLQRDGVDITSMGLTLARQPYNPPPTHPTLADPLDLETEGLVTQANRASRRLWLGMKYWDGRPVLQKARMISKPTKRFYLSAKEIGDLCRGRGAAKNQVRPLVQVGEIMAVVTERGVLEARECVERGLGGLVLCRIW